MCVYSFAYIFKENLKEGLALFRMHSASDALMNIGESLKVQPTFMRLSYVFLQNFWNQFIESVKNFQILYAFQ